MGSLVLFSMSGEPMVLPPKLTIGSPPKVYIFCHLSELRVRR